MLRVCLCVLPNTEHVSLICQLNHIHKIVFRHHTNKRTIYFNFAVYNYTATALSNSIGMKVVCCIRRKEPGFETTEVSTDEVSGKVYFLCYSSSFLL